MMKQRRCGMLSHTGRVRMCSISLQGDCQSSRVKREIYVPYFVMLDNNDPDLMYSTYRVIRRMRGTCSLMYSICSGMAFLSVSQHFCSCCACWAQLKNAVGALLTCASIRENEQCIAREEGEGEEGHTEQLVYA